MDLSKSGAPGRTRTRDPRLRTPKARVSPGRPETIRPDFTACFEGGRQLLPTPDHDGVSHLCHTGPLPLKRSSQRRTAAATLVPKREDLDAFRIGNQPVVDVIANTREVKTTNACERNVSGAGADLGLNGDEQRGASSSSRIALGAFGGLTRHQSWATRICARARSLTST